MKSCVGGPRTVTYVLVDVGPLASIVCRILRLSPTLGTITVDVPSPYQVVAIWLEAKDLGMESIGGSRGSKDVPCSARVSGVEEFVSISD